MLEQVLSGSQVIFQIARFFIVMAIGVSFTRGVIMPITGKMMVRRDSSKKARHSFENFAGLAGLFFTILIALQAASFGNLVTILGTLAAAATVAIGFGMRDQVSSVVAGVFIHTDNPFIKGDYIRVDEVEGKVKEIKLRTTKLNSGGTTRIVPNNILTTKTVENLSRGNRVTGKVRVKVSGDRAEKAESILAKVIEKREEILEKPKPEISFSQLEEGKVELEVEFSIEDSADLGEIRSQVMREFNDRAWKRNIYTEEE